MKKEITAVVFGLIFCAFLVGAQTAIAPLEQKDVIALSEPAIVKIYHQMNGDLSVPTLKLNIKTMTLSVDENFKASPETTYVVSPDSVISYKFDQAIDNNTIYGTGFVVNPNGYVVTNAHVVSDVYLKRTYLSDFEKKLVDEMIKAYDAKYPGKLDKLYPTSSEQDIILGKLDAYLLKLFMDSAKFSPAKLVVTPQSSTDTTLANIMKNGFTAQIISITDDLFSEKNHDKDVAVIKIEQNNLPALKIDATKSAQIGQKIYVWGFPSTATLNKQDVIKPTFTQGIVNAFKESADKSFNLIQTDAKISSGSSGSPIFNEKGEVVGIITYASSGDSSTAGDTFAWGLPSDFVLQVMKNGAVSNNTNYYDNFSAGVTLMNEKKCASAIQKFNKIKTANEKFSVDLSIQPYLDTCAEMISSGQSIDSVWAQIWVDIKDFLYRSWVLILMFFACVAALAFEIVTLKLENKKEEAEISNMETLIGSQGKDIESLKGQSKNPPPVNGG